VLPAPVDTCPTLEARKTGMRCDPVVDRPSIRNRDTYRERRHGLPVTPAPTYASDCEIFPLPIKANAVAPAIPA